jgi:hypothetical protein
MLGPTNRSAKHILHYLLEGDSLGVGTRLQASKYFVIPTRLLDGVQ